jgi:hypothetical protein
MRLLIDKANLVNIARQYKRPSGQDALHTMQTQLDVEFNFTKQDAQEDELLNFWFQEFSEVKGADNRHYFNSADESPFTLQDNTNATWTKKHTAFVIEKPDEIIKRYQQAGQLMVYGLGEEFDFFKTIFLGYPNRESHRGLRIGDEGLRKWLDLLPYTTPLTDIVLIDRYIASDGELVDVNLLPILKLLHTGKKSRTNILLLTDKQKLGTGLTPVTLAAKIKAAVAQVPGCSANVTVVCWNNSTAQNRRDYPQASVFEEHDRTLVTNYTRWKSGDTFNYFNSAGQRITKGRELDLFSLAKRDNLKLVLVLLKDIQTYLEWCRINNPDNIQGDRTSGLVNIPTK